MMLNDWIRGKIPYFAEPPQVDLPEEEEKMDFVEDVHNNSIDDSE